MTRVLVVDDHALVRRGVRQLLVDELPEIVVDEAGDAEAAEARLAAERYDLVIVDLNLPGRSGLTLLESARDSRALGQTPPLLVVSVYPEAEFAVRCLRLGAAGYLSKDGAAEELVQAVRQVLAGKRYVTSWMAERLAGLQGGVAAPPGAAPLEELSERELQVLRLVSQGLTLRQIAVQLEISEKTVASYRARVSEKLGVSTNVELTRFALRHRLVD